MSATPELLAAVRQHMEAAAEQLDLGGGDLSGILLLTVTQEPGSDTSSMTWSYCAGNALAMAERIRLAADAIEAKAKARAEAVNGRPC